MGRNYSPETLFEVVARGGTRRVSYATCDTPDALTAGRPFSGLRARRGTLRVFWRVCLVYAAACRGASRTDRAARAAGGQRSALRGAAIGTSLGRCSHA